MATTTFDTLSFAKKLKSVSFTEDQAEVQVEAINSALSGFQNKNLQLAAKKDIAMIQTSMATKTDLANTKAEIIKWVAGMLLAQIAAGVTLFKLL